MNLRQALVFAILMQGNGGVLTKHPSYMLEKLRAVREHNEPEVWLDTFNMAIFRQYLDKWKVSVEDLSEIGR